MRNKTAIALAVLGLFVAGIADAGTKRILIVGDSWAMSLTAENRDGFPAPDVFDQVLAANGLGDYETQGAVTAWGGRKASDWAKQKHRDEIVGELTKYPTIDIVHLVVGGNDLLDAVTKGDFRNKTPEERDVLWTSVQRDIQTIVDTCLGVRDNLRVVLADYDYLDPEAAEQFWGPVSGMDFHGATVAQVNAWLVELGRKKRTVAERTPRCEYVQNWGTLQYWFGSPPKAVPYPGQAPAYDPYPGGVLAKPMPPGLSPDGIHPNAEAHARLLQNAIDQYYKRWLAPTPQPAEPVEAKR